MSVFRTLVSLLKVVFNLFFFFFLLFFFITTFRNRLNHFLTSSPKGNGPYGSDVPAVASRSLEPNSTFAIAQYGVTTGTTEIQLTLHNNRFIGKRCLFVCFFLNLI